MHPQIEKDHPGDCPICGMALEPKDVISDSPEDNTELVDMTRRFWIGAALAVPVFLLGMAHIIPTSPHWLGGEVSRWIQFALSTPVVLWAAAPFFERGWRSLRTMNLNMTGSFVMKGGRVGSETMLSQIVQIVAEAQRSRPPIQRAADRVAAYFVRQYSWRRRSPSRFGQSSD